MYTDPVTIYPALAHVVPSLSALGAAAEPVQVPTGTTLFSDNSACQGFPLVLEGEVKVSRRSTDGRALELYRVIPGELCLVSSASLFRSSPVLAQGVATRPTLLLLITPSVFVQWLEVPVFRNAVLGLFAERMADLTGLSDAVSFQPLAATQPGRGQHVALIHKQLTDELGNGAGNWYRAALSAKARWN